LKRRPYRLKRRAESAEETRRRIVQATAELHSEQGIAATTMKQIAERAGVGTGTVYHHFPTLDDTILACGQRTMDMFPPPKEEIFAGVRPLRERLTRLAHALFGHRDAMQYDRVRHDLESNPAVRHFVVAEETNRIELTRAALAPFAVDRDLIRVVAALLDIAVYRGLQRAGLSLEEAAAAIAEIIHARVTRKD
jgi:AcrR family transcriptional regulator